MVIFHCLHREVTPPANPKGKRKQNGCIMFYLHSSASQLTNVNSEIDSGRSLVDPGPLGPVERLSFVT